jgi:CHAT domain-containing protein/tetratricopeptide (TPR) repeat protein
MSGKVFFILPSFLLILCFSSIGKGTPSLKSIQANYRRIDRLFNQSDNSSSIDSTCLEGFKQIIAALKEVPRGGLTDSLLFQCQYKIGVLFDEFKDYPRANAAYIGAIDYTTAVSDKFRMYVLAGAGYYNLNNFDSATFYLLKAEEIPEGTGTDDDRVRLYNTLGVLYYDNGNYLQSKNYFSQALRLIESKDLVDDLKVYTLLNLATCSYKLGLYDQTLTLYKKILQYHLLPDPLYLNMGKAYSGLHQYNAALSAYKKVKRSKEPGVLNEMARTALETGSTDSAKAWLIQFQHEKKALHTNALDDGVNELYFGYLELLLDRPDSALRYLQEALIIFSRNFSDRNVRKNPVNFTGSFGYYRLFEVLMAKASAWEKMYDKSANPTDLSAANDVYQSAIRLLSYIERSYEMDDAKILLKQKSGELYTKALNACVRLNELFPKGNFLDSAFLISEKNKASIMSAQIRESNFLQLAQAGDEWAALERNIKYNIARLNSKADEGADAQTLQKINDEKSAYETQLVLLRRKMEGNKRFYQLKYMDDFPSVGQLQSKMNSDQALISFYNEPDNIDIFVLTKSTLNLIRLDSGIAIRQNIEAWITSLQSVENGHHINTTALGKGLYQQIIKPIVNLAEDKQEWIIVPDGVFFLLPIESLPGDEKGRPLIEKHAVSYEFSARFILEDKKPFQESSLPYATLSFAPYSQQGADLQKEGMGKLDRLPFSQIEIEKLIGSQYLDKEATKDKFLQNLNHFPIVHLATHAMTDLDNSSASYISFFPSAGIRSDDFLFLDEIYSLRMDSCRMMVISACETGKGTLVRNEGVMSFARAFLYAGCPSTINTLWKADDHSTAEILSRFYTYLDEGDSKSRALQKAKLDFIKDHPIYRNPAYWSHIVIMGNADALYKKKQPWIWVVLLTGLGATSFFLTRKKIEKSRRLS